MKDSTRKRFMQAGLGVMMLGTVIAAHTNQRNSFDEQMENVRQGIRQVRKGELPNATITLNRVNDYISGEEELSNNSGPYLIRASEERTLERRYELASDFLRNALKEERESLYSFEQRK